MKKTLLLIAIFCITISFAQTHRFFYDLTIRKPTDTATINMVLDIDKDKSKFYDEEFLKVDSINKSSNQKMQTNSESNQLLIRKTNTSENQQFLTHTYDYFVVRSNDKMNWKLEKEIKKIENITLQKASTNFGGRKWIAWFDSKIPFQEGPYKFNGLSGLVYEVYDSENIFHYALTKNKNLPKTYDTTDFLETHYGKKPIPISLKQYQKVKLDYYNNIVEVLHEFAKKGGTIASEHDLSSPEEIEKKRKTLQQSIKKYYLPIEKDKAIPYPND
ncbi:GLPGLI family protein [Chryseobacterium manosquense]|uniref:GLPGLI family protein n=1 Tax=Chryseobacterium manosquense TaxID=2754694 RepID=A0A7H1DTI4_9FLAO|nr:GLPGLI family protein [Chryseobacterium manosquense]QNS40292.1 GLPGLI family protein [Chryseobacterium manosquense]